MKSTSHSALASAAYFDCNATTPTLPVAAKAAVEAMQILFGNPSSSHLVGLQAKNILEGTRRLGGRILGVAPQQLVFTSGATEAIQTAIFSVLETAKSEGRATRGACVLYGATEHKAVPQALRHWVKALDLPVDVVAIPVDGKGQVDLSFLARELPRSIMLCTMAVNNETGVVQDLAAIEAVLEKSASAARWLVDSVQALGKIDLRLSQSRIDYATFSGHKLYAPKGIGFLYVRPEAPIVPLMVGGGQERGLRSGTENLPGVAAMGALFQEMLKGDGQSCFLSHDRLAGFRDQLVSELKRSFPKVEFNTPFEVSVPTTINFSIPGLASKELLDLFDAAGVRLSAGSACSSTSVEPSYVLDAMGIPEWRSVSAVRLSFGPCTSEKEITRGCRAIREAAMALRHSCMLSTAGGFDAPQDLRDGVIQFRAGPMNTWVIADKEARTAVVIDPCDVSAERVEGYLRCQGLKILAIVDTHSHADHPSTRPSLSAILVEQMSVGAVDELGWPSSGTVPLRLQHGETVDALVLGQGPRGARRVLARLRTPGHTHDSSTFLLGFEREGVLSLADVQFAFCGDTILSGGLGRTNFTVSDTAMLYRSLRLLSAEVGRQALLCPAHDYDNSFGTTLETEMRENALLALAIDEPEGSDAGLRAFVEEKNKIDQRLAAIDREFEGIVCGVTAKGAAAADAAIQLSCENLRRELAQDAGSYVLVDVREPQEHVLFKKWSTLGWVSGTPQNIPMSRFVNFMRQVIDERGAERAPIVLVCRSGNRSLQAAKTLRRMGVSRVYSLAGGLALLT